MVSQKLFLFSLLSIAYVTAQDSSSSSSSEECDDGDNDSQNRDDDQHHHHHQKHRGTNCPPGWDFSRRAKANWCLKVYPGTVDNQGAESFCQSVGGTLTGIENSYERSILVNQATQVATSLGKHIGSFWVGAKRRTECLGPNKMASICLPWATRAYEWTDRYCSGTAGFFWRPGQPDYYVDQQPCVYMHIVFPDVPLGYTAGATSGSFDDTGCGSAYGNPLQSVLGYSCGKLAE